MRTAEHPQLVTPSTVGQCDTMLVEARAAWHQAVRDLEKRDDATNRAACEAAVIGFNHLLDCRSRLTNPRKEPA